jgi:hypothetical protein
MKPLSAFFKSKKEEEKTVDETVSRDSTVVPSNAESLREKRSSSDLTDNAPNAVTEKNSELKDGQAGEDEQPEYPKGIPLAIICTGLALAVFLVALVRGNILFLFPAPLNDV